MVVPADLFMYGEELHLLLREMKNMTHVVSPVPHANVLFSGAQQSRSKESC
jgi:hypothetical protein